MINKKQLLDKRDLYINYKKVINLKRIKLQKEIDNYKKQVSFVKQSIWSMESVKKLLSEQSKFLSFFEQGFNKKKENIKNIFIFIQTKDNTSIGKYSDEIILEHIEKNIDQSNDKIYVSGARLFNKIKVKFKDINVLLLDDFIKFVNQESINKFPFLFEKISEISFTLYSDKLVDKVSLFYSDIEKSNKLFEFTILPFDLNAFKRQELKKDKNNLNDDVENKYLNKIFNDFKNNNKKTTFISQITNINKTFLKLLLSSLSKYVVINYLLNMSIRKMISIDDEEKNLEKRMKRNHLDLLKARNESITNEMIQISAARKIIIKKKIQSLEENSKGLQKWTK